MLKKYIFIAFTFLIIISLCLTPFAHADVDDSPPDGFDSWEDYFNSLINGGGESNVEVPSFESMMLVGENERLSFYLHEEGVDAYVVEKKSGKIWGTAVHPDYLDTASLRADETTLFADVAVADETGSIATYQLSDNLGSEFSVTYEYTDNKVTVMLAVIETGISFSVDLTLTEDGFEASIPINSLKETGSHKLVFINLLPSFGAASHKENGYIFYPDGSGALIQIKPYKLLTAQVYSYPIYGASDQNIDIILDNEEQDIKNLTLPVYGIKHTDGGFLAAITEGDETASLHLSMNNLYRGFFQFDYRVYSSVEYNFTGQVQDTQKISELVDERIDANHTVRYFLLEEDKNTYSDMAVAYRNHLVSTGVLKKAEKESALTLSLELFMGITEKGFFTDKYLSLNLFTG